MHFAVESILLQRPPRRLLRKARNDIIVVMERLKKLLLVFVLGTFFTGISAPAVSAQGILPKAPPDCFDKVAKDEMVDGATKTIFVKKMPENEVVAALKDDVKFEEYVKGNDRRKKISEALGCAVKLGKIRLFMVPLFITFIIQFLLAIAGLVAVLFVVIGGYHYVVGGLIEDKEKGKKTIQHALIGLIVALSAWMVINFIQVALTS